jgi:membrane protein YqaA with SNARE-associated domain
MAALFEQTKKTFLGLRVYANRPWFLPLHALLAGLDFFVALVPTDALLISCVLLNPKRWARSAAWFTVGSTAGGFVLALLLEHWGAAEVHAWIGARQDTAFWKYAENWVASYGSWVVLVFSASPFAVLPGVVLCSLAGVPATELGGMILAGRAVKYSFIAAVTVRAPKLLLRLPFLEK